jgi:hypothetical protein
VNIFQSVSRVVMLKMVLTGTTTPATGKTVAVTISKAGGAFANPSAGATNAVEVGNGWYKVTLSVTDTNTLGDLVVLGTEVTCDNSERVFNVSNDILDVADAIEVGLTPRQALRAIAAAAAGVVSGNGTGTVVFLGLGVGTTRLTATIDANKNRTNIVSNL